MAMSAHGLWRGLLAAGSIGLAACASPAGPVVQASAYRPVMRSTLVSRAEPTFLQAQVQKGEQWETVLARRDATRAAEPVPVAVIRYAGSGADELVSVQFVSDRGSPALEVLGLEELYAVMLRHDAQGRYCLSLGPRPCDASRDGVSHAALLRQLAGERKRAASIAGDPFPMTTWRSISMHAAAASSSDPDDVAVQVSDESGTMVGVTVYFNRAPHSGCAAKTGADGVAACRLIDQHGDDDGDADEHARTRVIVTYPGDVGPERVLLPTTFVLPARSS